MAVDPGAGTLARHFGILAWTVSELDDHGGATIAFAVRYKEHVVVVLHLLTLTTTLGINRNATPPAIASGSPRGGSVVESGFAR
jgi:hypothetical protein